MEDSRQSEERNNLWTGEPEAPDSALIRLNYQRPVLLAFVKPLPRKQCGAGLINAGNAGRLDKAGAGCFSRII